MSDVGLQDAIDISWVQRGTGGPRATLRLRATSARYRSLAGGVRPDEVGSYEVAVDATTAEEIDAIAAAVIGLGSRAAAGGLEVLRISRESSPAHFGEVALGPHSDEPEAAARLRTVAAAIVDECLERRAATVSLAAATVDVPGSPDPALELTFTATGPSPVALLLRPASIAVVPAGVEPREIASGDWIWHMGDRAVVGLRDADRRLLDGVHRPARLSPGHSGRLLILHAADARHAGTPAQVAVECFVDAPLDGTLTGDDFPDDAALLVALLDNPRPPSS